MAGELQGIVSSTKRDKTITVSIASRETHPLYRKQYTKNGCLKQQNRRRWQKGIPTAVQAYI